MKTIESKRVGPNQVDVIVYNSDGTEESRKPFNGPSAQKDAEAEVRRAIDAGDAARK